MMKLLREIRDHCLGIDNDRVTFRQKSEESLSHLLVSSRAIEALNAASSEGSKEFHWDDVYSYALRYLKREAAPKVTSKSSGRLKSASSLIKTVVRKGGALFKTPGIILEDMLDILLEKSFLRDVFGFDALLIIERIIVLPEYARLIPVQIWTLTLPKALFAFFESPPKDSDFLVLSRIFKRVIQESSTYTHISYSSKLPFLANILNEAKLGAGSFEAKSAFLSACLLLLKEFERDERKAICAFGEVTLTTVLSLFHDAARHHRHEGIVSFLRFQVSVHHPYGARTEQEGFYAEDQVLWVKHLYGIYSNVIDNRSKNSLKSSGQTSHLDAPLVDLGIEIVRQLFSQDQEVIRDITQVVPLNETFSSQPPSAKKRRVLQIGFESMMENIRDDDKNISIPWLQILSGLLFRYPKDSLSPSTFNNVFSQVNFALQSSKLISVKSEVLKTLEALKRLSQVCGYKANWSMVWESTLNVVSLNQCAEEGHSLIRLLMVDMPAKELKRLMDIYLNKIVKCNVHSVRTLVALISITEIPDKVSGRQSILSWLCPIHQGEEGESLTESWSGVLQKDPGLVASLLVGLCLQSSMDLCLSSQVANSSEIYSQSDSPLLTKNSSNAEYKDSPIDRESKRLETLILESDLILLPGSLSINTPTACDNSRASKPQINSTITTQISDLLVKLSGEILDRLNERRNDDNPLDLIKEALHQCLLLSSIVNQWKRCNAELGDKLSRLTDVYISCIKQASMVSLRMLGSDKKVFDVLFIWKGFLSSRSKITDYLIWNNIPLDFIEKAVTVFLRRCKKAKNSSTQNTSKKTAPDEFDDFDAFNSNPSDNENDLMDVDEFQEQAIDQLNQKKDLKTLLSNIVPLSCPSIPVSDSDRSSFFNELRKKIIEVLNSLNDQFDDSFTLEILHELVQETCEDFIDGNFLEDVLTSCQQIAKRSTRPKNFNPQVSLGLLRILTTLVPLVHQRYFIESQNTVSLKNFLMFLIAFFRMNAQLDYKRLSIRIQCQILDLLYALTTIDPSGQWAVWPTKIHNIAAIDDREAGVIEDDDGSVHVGKSMIRFLGHSSHRLREQSAKYVPLLFSSSEQSVQDKKFNFQILCSTLNHLLKNGTNIQGTNEDDRGNRFGTLLLTLSCVSSCCEFLERESLSKIILFFHEYNISIVSLRRVVNNLARKKGFEKVEDYFASILGYVLRHFISEGFQLERFPYEILSHSFKSFLQKYEKVVVPLLLWNNHETISSICKFYSGRSKEKIIEDNFSVLNSYFLPIIAAKDESPELLREMSHTSIQRASKLHELVFRTLNKDKFNYNLTSKVHEILAEVFKNIHDPEALAKEFNLNVPKLGEPSPPFTDQKLVMNLIEYFEVKIPQRNDKSLLEFLGENISSCLLDMCLNFMSAFKTPTDEDTRIRSLHGVKIFIDSLHPSDSFKHLTFIMWYLSDALLKSLTDTKNSEFITRLCLKVLHSLLKVCVHHSPSSLNPFFVPIVNVLISKYSNHEAEVQSLLNYLILDSSKMFMDQIRKLAPFPTSGFEKYNWILEDIQGERSLREDINSFLDDTVHPSRHRLEFLLFSLSSKKNELNDILEEMGQSEILSERTSTSPIHSLIDKLLNLFSKDVEKEAVSRCLGEIGPLNLHSFVVKPFYNILTSEASSPEKDYLKEIVFLLLDLILSEHQTNTRMAYEALHKLCRIDIFVEIIQNIEEFKKALLAPFYLGLEKHEIIDSEIMIDFNFQDPSSWIIDEEENFDEWIIERVSTILNKHFHQNSYSIFTPLKTLCETNPKFCEAIFPFLIHVLLLNGDEDVKEGISSKFNGVFSENTRNRGHPRCIKCCLNVIRHLRLQNRPCKRRQDLATKWSNNFWLNNMNYLHVAEASLNASEYFESILYVEIWTQTMVEKFGKVKLKMCVADRGSVLDILFEDFPRDGLKCQRILYEAFEALGNKDACNGCGDSRLLEGNESGLIDQLALEGESFKVLGFCDSLMPKSRQKYLRTMFDSGLYHTLYSYLVHNTIIQDEGGEDDARDLRYECAWRLSQWDDVQSSSNRRGNKSFSECRYSCLSKCIRGEEEDLRHSLVSARASISLTDVNSSIGVSKILGQFMALQEIECLKLKDPMIESRHLNYQYSVDTKLQRVIFYESLLQGISEREKASEYWEKNCTNLAETALAHSDFHVAKSCILSLKRHGKVGNELLKFKSQFLESKLLWEWNNKETAVRLLKKLSNELSVARQEEVNCIYPQVLGTLGQWMYIIKSESAPIILEKYLKKSVSLYEDLNDGALNISLILEAYINLASFCDDQYQSLTDHIKSKDFEDKQKLMKEIQEESSTLNEVGDVKLVKQSAVILNRHSNIDKLEVESIQRDQGKYLLLALEHYLNAFISGDSKYDLKIFRFVSLWFSNAKDVEVCELVGNRIKEIRTFKFVNLLYQLAARMTLKREDANFGKILMGVMLQCLRDHPYHTLPVVLALANSQADDAFTSVKGSKKSGGSIGDEDRTAAAKKLLECFKKIDKTYGGSLLSDLDSICITLIQFANEESPPQKSSESGRIKIGPSKPIRRISNLDHVPILTETIPVSKNGKYSFVGINGFSDFYENVGGINAPKKIYCMGTDGLKRPILVKGKDDLRQDAVMQQVFNLMNSLLKDPNLKVQTYKVVALSQRSGVLEWCQNTMPLKDYLIGPDYKSGAHVRFHPNDFSAHDCRTKLHKAQASKNHALKLKAFNDICENFHPVMRHFFLEHFPSPEMHYERREAYTRSAAAASMVGYILGLGDRHIQNILIHKVTGHLIHIDLGIAFEQGKILPSPETIPFRLTRDIVDGFGPCGVEGTFRRSCESTLSVLRGNKESIATILQVMVYDPLYNWSLTPDKAYRLQFGKAPDAKAKARWEQRNDSPNEGGGNRMAERVLLRVGQKLNGFEDGFNMSIQGQVNALIQQARDPNRLCALFHGWSPFV